MFKFRRDRPTLLAPSGLYRDLSPRCLIDRRDALNEMLRYERRVELRVAVYAYAEDFWLLSATTGIQEAGEPVRLPFDIADSILGHEVLDLLLRCYAFSAAPPTGKLQDWAVFRASGMKSGRAFESGSTYVSIRTINTSIELEASRRKPQSDLYVGQALNATSSPELFGRAVRRVVRAVRLLDSLEAL